ncbi:MAG: pentapeptide repeat-containing protein [Leptolyngbyaceae cyanobacterium bins.349]|nr:pentapeptide repeat-containing protein [Leptolyngbyaceae cyanobacterium bins.349]
MTYDPNSKPAIPPAPTPPNGARAMDSEAVRSALTAEEIAVISQRNLTASPDLRSPRSNGMSVLAAASVSPTAPRVLVLLLAIVIMFAGLIINSFWIGIAGSLVALAISIQILWSPLRRLLVEFIPEQERAILFGSLFGVIALFGFLQMTGVFRRIGANLANLGWDAIGALGEVLGAVGQILIAILAVYIAWRQYIISRDLTIQQNTITQQQTIDAYFQGVSDLVLDEEGLLEDWPQERAIAEGRTAAILSSVDASGKAKIIRFLSRARLLSPLRRDLRLGRAILDGTGGYEEDRLRGVRVIDLGVMLAGADLSGTDLRWTDLSEANLIRANLSRTDLVKANLARTILCDAKLSQADINGTRFFYGKPEDASPRSRLEPPNYRTGRHTGAVIEGADFTDVQQMTDDQRYYCCAWGGSKTRSTIPGGCEGIPNKLGR